MQIVYCVRNLDLPGRAALLRSVACLSASLCTNTMVSGLFVVVLGVVTQEGFTDEPSTLSTVDGSRL